MLKNPRQIGLTTSLAGDGLGHPPATWSRAAEVTSDLLLQVERFVGTLYAWDGDRSKTAEAKVVGDAIAGIGAMALKALFELGCPSWAFRQRVNERITLFETPDRIASPLRRYVGTAHRWAALGDRKKAIEALELVAVIAAELAYRLLGKSLDELTLTQEEQGVQQCG